MGKVTSNTAYRNDINRSLFHRAQLVAGLSGIDLEARS